MESSNMLKCDDVIFVQKVSISSQQEGDQFRTS